MRTRCTAMSAVTNGPWSCGDPMCRGQRSDCTARRRNVEELLWVTERQREKNERIGPWDPFTSATNYMLGIPDPEISRQAARRAIDRRQ